jgi:phage head maturation protease
MAELSSADINNLPDGDFAYIEPGGKKDFEGKTTPRSLRHFPIHDAAHVRNALARASQSPFGEKAMPKIRAAAKKLGVEVGEEQQAAGRAEPLPFERGDVMVRAMLPGPEFQEVEGKMPKLVGTLAVFDEWAEIKGSEGHFMERLSRGAFTKTIRDHPDVPVMYQHGQDPQIGPKPLGTIDRLVETPRGVDYEVSLFDVDYVRSILPALRAGKAAGMGSSFTFSKINGKYEIERWPQRSAYNPEQWPEVTHHEIRMLEFGPGVLPYYAGTTTGLRSATDEFLFARLAQDPERFQQLLTTADESRTIPAATALSNERAEAIPHSGGESRNVQPTIPVRRFHTSEDFVQWLNSKT